MTALSEAEQNCIFVANLVLSDELYRSAHIIGVVKTIFLQQI